MLKGFIFKRFHSYRYQLPEVCRKYWNVRQHLTLFHCQWMLCTDPHPKVERSAIATNQRVSENETPSTGQGSIVQ